jgi:hypothetical protein
MASHTNGYIFFLIREVFLNGWLLGICFFFSVQTLNSYCTETSHVHISLTPDGEGFISVIGC